MAAPQYLSVGNVVDPFESAQKAVGKAGDIYNQFFENKRKVDEGNNALLQQDYLNTFNEKEADRLENQRIKVNQQNDDNIAITKQNNEFNQDINNRTTLLAEQNYEVQKAARAGTKRVANTELDARLFQGLDPIAITEIKRIEALNDAEYKAGVEAGTEKRSLEEYEESKLNSRKQSQTYKATVAFLTKLGLDNDLSPEQASITAQALATNTVNIDTLLAEKVAQTNQYNDNLGKAADTLERKADLLVKMSLAESKRDANVIASALQKGAGKLTYEPGKPELLMDRYYNAGNLDDKTIGAIGLELHKNIMSDLRKSNYKHAITYELMGDMMATMVERNLLWGNDLKTKDLAALQAAIETEWKGTLVPERDAKGNFIPNSLGPDGKSRSTLAVYRPDLFDQLDQLSNLRKPMPTRHSVIRDIVAEAYGKQGQTPPTPLAAPASEVLPPPKDEVDTAGKPEVTAAPVSAAQALINTGTNIHPDMKRYLETRHALNIHNETFAAEKKAKLEQASLINGVQLTQNDAINELTQMVQKEKKIIKDLEASKNSLGLSALATLNMHKFRLDDANERLRVLMPIQSPERGGIEWVRGLESEHKHRNSAVW